MWPNCTFRVLIYERKIHAKIEFFIKNNKILKFFSCSKNKSCLTKSWDFLQKLTLFLKFAREIGEYKKRRCRGNFFFSPLFFCFQPNSRATKRARLQASEARKYILHPKVVYIFGFFILQYYLPPFHHVFKWTKLFFYWTLVVIKNVC
jgi:hypothetical protein